MALRRWMAALLSAGWLAASGVAAQEPTDPEPSGPDSGAPAEPTDEAEPSDVRRLDAARRAFDRGTAYALSEDYGRAAAQFETAYRLFPNPQALERAIQAHLRVGHTLRACSLALQLAVAHADNEPTRAAAEEVLATHGHRYVRLELDCDECILAVEGRVRSFHQLMLEPNTDHVLTVERDGRQRSHTVRGRPGETLRVGAPAPSDGVARVEERPPGLDRAGLANAGLDGAGPVAATPPSDRMPLPPWVFGSAVGLTIVASAILVWSGVDTLAGVDDFNRMPTRRGFEEGEAKEARTNVLIAVTLSLAALSVLAAILTDWGGERPNTSAGLFFDGRAAGAWAHHRF